MAGNNFKQQLNRIKINRRHNCLIADSGIFTDENNFLNSLAAALAGDIDILIYSDSRKSPKAVLILAKKIKTLCLEFDVTFIIKSRLDVAYAASADGVHLTSDDLPADIAREILGENTLIGYTIGSNIPDNADYYILKESTNIKLPDNIPVFINDNTAPLKYTILTPDS